MGVLEGATYAADRYMSIFSTIEWIVEISD
jgi:hypothetical protein